MLKDDVFENWKLFLVNRYPPFTSPYRWAEDLHWALNAKIEWINLKFEENGWQHEHKGADFRGALGGKFNILFRQFAFKAAKNYIENHGKKILVHYTNQFSGTLNIKGIEVVSVHDSPYYLEDLGFIGRLYTKHLYNSLKDKPYIVTNTEVLTKELKDYGFSGKIETVHLAYSPAFKQLKEDKKSIRRRLGLPEDKVLVLSVSSDLPRKNLSNIKKAMELLGDDYRLVRVGPSIGNSVTFTSLSDQRLNEVYNACDVMLFPSLYEGFGLPVVEAFATGLPVVTSDIPTIREVAGGAALLVNPKDLNEITKGIKTALENQELTDKGLERAKLFTRETFRDNIVKLYTAILNSS